MGCPENLENGTQLGEKFFPYGGTLTLAASAVAMSDGAKIMPLLEKLPECHSSELVEHIFGATLHSDLLEIV